MHPSVYPNPIFGHHMLSLGICLRRLPDTALERRPDLVQCFSPFRPRRGQVSPSRSRGREVEVVAAGHLDAEPPEVRRAQEPQRSGHVQRGRRQQNADLLAKVSG